MKSIYKVINSNHVPLLLEKLTQIICMPCQSQGWQKIISLFIYFYFLAKLFCRWNFLRKLCTISAPFTFNLVFRLSELWRFLTSWQKYHILSYCVAKTKFASSLFRLPFVFSPSFWRLITDQRIDNSALV